MTDSSFHRFAGACAIALAVCAVLYALLLFADTQAVGVMERARLVLSARGLNQPANLLLGVIGLLTMAAVMGLYDALRHAAPAWMAWGAACGVVGAALTAAHGFWDLARLPVLLEQWESGNRVRQAAVSTFAGVANPVDPKGLGSFLLVGLFAVVAARTWSARGSAPAVAGGAGLLFGLLSVVLFAAGFVGPESVRTALAAVTVGVVGPIWWALVGRHLWALGGAAQERSSG